MERTTSQECSKVIMEIDHMLGERMDLVAACKENLLKKSLTTANWALSQEQLQLQEENRTLQEEIQRLQEENRKLQEENRKLKKNEEKVQEELFNAKECIEENALESVRLLQQMQLKCQEALLKQPYTEIQLHPFNMERTTSQECSKVIMEINHMLCDRMDLVAACKESLVDRVTDLLHNPEEDLSVAAFQKLKAENEMLSLVFKGASREFLQAMEEKNKEIEKLKKSLTTANWALAQEQLQLQEENRTLQEENRKLQEDNWKLQEENRKLKKKEEKVQEELFDAKECIEQNALESVRLLRQMQLKCQKALLKKPCDRKMERDFDQFLMENSHHEKSFPKPKNLMPWSPRMF
uniref:Coiled-coil domain containing 146 n=1 Tax=Steinernema glaseri TaxID=37863 RepID=A0A1I7YM98_9BILA